MFKNTPKSAILVALIVIFTSSLSAKEPSDFEKVFGKLEKSIRKVTLDNGLKLIMIKQDYAPVVAAYMKFKAGSADEKPGSWGIAHMLEHMLFKGTQIVGTNDYAKEHKYHLQSIAWMKKLDAYQMQADQAQKDQDQKKYISAIQNIQTIKKRLDGLYMLSRRYVIPEEDSYLYSMHGSDGYNAYTMSDLTNYQIQLPSNRLEVWARLESDRLENATLRDFYYERNVVREERRMRYDNDPPRTLYEMLIEKAYGPEHPYGKSVIGPMNSIKYLNYDKAMEFYKTYYAPNNSVISLVGDIDFDKTTALVKKYFEPLKKRKVPEPLKVQQPDPKSFDLTVQMNSRPFMVLAWFKPAMPDPADSNINLLSDILTAGPQSRLYKRLITEKRLASSVGSYNAYPGERYTNLFIIQVNANKFEDYDLIKNEIQAELDLIMEEGVHEDELDRVRNTQKADFIFKLQSNSFLADQLSYFEILYGNYRVLFDYYFQFESTTPRDIQISTKNFLSANKRMSIAIIPAEKKTN